MPESPNQKNIVHGSITAGGSVTIGDTTYIDKYFAGKEVKIPHRLTNYIPTNAEYILGRDTELEIISKYLEAKKPTVLVNGIGGIGKTSVAIKYMAIHGAEYKHLAWITVQSSILETFISNSALLESLQITEKVQDLIKAKQLDNAFELVFHQLNILEKTLVVLDNANDLEDLEKYEHLFDTASCDFLITSRTYPPEWTTIAIDSLPEEESLQLFKKLHPSVQASDEAIKSLLSKLYYHTLLIELVAKSIESSAYLFEELQEIIEKQFIHSEALNEDVVSTGKHGAVIKDNLKRSKIEDYIWLIFSKVKGLDEKSRNILKSMALLPLAFMIERNGLKEHLSIFDLKEPMPALIELVERGWIDRVRSFEQKTYFKMHPLIADVVVKHLEVDVNYASNFIEQVTSLIAYEPTNPNDNLLEKKQYEPLAERLGYLFLTANTARMSDLLHNLNWYNREFGFYQKALFYGEQAVKTAKNTPNMDEFATATYQSVLAVVYQDLGRFTEAAELLEIALASDERTFEKNNPNIAIRQTNLASVYDDLGRYNEAAYLLERALISFEKNFEKHHPNVTTAQSNLSQIYRNLGRLPESLFLLENALESDERTFGKDHPSLAITQYNLGITYTMVERKEEAQTLFQKAYLTWLNFFGSEHPYTMAAKEKLQ